MLTALLILAVLFTVAVVALNVYAAVDGCFFAWWSIAFGGLGQFVTVMGELIGSLLSAVTGD